MQLPLPRTFWPISAILLAVLVFNLYWYGAYLSFPLMTEDGASNYSSLVDVASLGPLLTSIPISFLEGLGQPNLFVTATYDPFSWLMFLDGDKADLFRISTALRATACWLTSYLFIKALSRGRMAVAVIGAFISLALNFTLTNPYGMPTYGGIFNGTHAALFPLLLWLYLRVSKQARWLGWPDLFLFALLTVFLLVYPLGSLIGLAVFFAFAASLVFFYKSSYRASASRAFLKLAIAVVVLLLTPGWGLYEAWSTVANISARKVFADELFSYGPAYYLPYFWDRHGPWPVRAIILTGLAALLFNRRWPRYLRITVSVLALVICISQALGIPRAYGIASSLFERLPRAFYLEFYLPIFYAAAAAFVIVHWHKVIRPSSRHLWRWLGGLVIFTIPAYVSLGPFALLLGIFIVTVGTITAVRTREHWAGISRWAVFSLLAFVTLRFIAMPIIALWTIVAARRFKGSTGEAPVATPAFRPLWITAGRLFLTAAILISAPSIWILAPDQVTRLFGDKLRCQNPAWWCQDPASITVNAGPHPLVEFLQENLRPRGVFQGRADFLLIPAPRLQALPFAPGEIDKTTFSKMLEWYRRGYEARVYKPSNEYAFPPESLTYDFPSGPTVAKLRYQLEVLASQGEVLNGVLPDDVLTEIVEWRDFNKIKGEPAKLRSPWTTEQEVALMVQERTRNFFTLGNGLMLRSLPMHHVPVATSYEQALDYLYYLFWTRYINLGATASRSINFTILETLNPGPLALMGVRYVIARDVPLTPEPRLRRVFTANGYGIYEIPDANVTGYGPTAILSPGSDSLSDELHLMRSPGFDPKKQAVVSIKARQALGSEVRLAPIKDAQIATGHQTIYLKARSQGGRSMAVLPFKYSHCWTPKWHGPQGTVIRVNLALIGVVFDESVDMELTWAAGYGQALTCLKQDAGLIPQAMAAARTIP